jgi:cephalosporin-C deacetylase-like acetyl esterase
MTRAQELPRLDASFSPPPQKMLQAFLQKIADEQLAARRTRIEAITTPEQVRARQKEIRRILLDSIGGLPPERTPLKLRRTGSLDRGDYRVDKIIYESQPGFYITANLYVPQTGASRYPAVLHPLGHSLTGKSRAFYQTISIGLVRQGFVVLTYDPIGQGERRIFFDGQIEDSLVGGATSEHQMVGVQSLPAGESVARYRIWDGMRSIDLLESLPEVDPDRMGIAGCSGGGTLTAYIATLDDRLKVAVPACYMSAWEEQLPGTGPQDAEQQFFDQLKLGLSHGDFAIAFAPKPYLICSTTEDFFPLEGARRTFEEARRLYRLMNAGDKIAWFVGPGGHGMPKQSREALYSWMKRWLQNEEGPASEGEIVLEYEEDLHATDTGQVGTSLGGETASTLNIRRARTIQPQRPALHEPGAVEKWRDSVRDELRSALRLEAATFALNLRKLETVRRTGYHVEQLVYDGGGRYVPAYLCRPSGPQKQRGALLYVDQRGKAAALAEDGDAAVLARAGYAVLTIDLSGLGETRSDWGGYSDNWFGPDKIIWLALMVGRPLAGLRVEDILRGIDLLASEGLLRNGVTGFGKGLAGAHVLFAAALDERIHSVLLEDSLVSYRAAAEAPIHRRLFEILLPGVLSKFDLPDIAAAVAPRPLSLVNAVSPMQQRLLLRAAEKEWEPARHAYEALGAGDQLRIGLRREGSFVTDAYPELH